MTDTLQAPTIPLITPPRWQQEEEERADRRFLIWGYLAAVFLPVLGVIYGIVCAVSLKQQRIRRHAVGLIAVAVLAGGAYFVIISAAQASHSSANAATDLKSLLDSNGISYSDVTCAHSSGNSYACIVDGQAVQVTDDGSSITEQGLTTQ